ncbi:unnamed protein product [Mytilus edulis]|uniref:Reverse transcriptase domain-containing protein n=1 Tax=Mytilus edulis TaxID=6550 RepID=A0A8S3RT52_MYTED|nr:unnamed protein product [Mytilus edulis]
MVRHAQSTDNETTEHVKFDTRNVPNDWLTDVEVVSKLNQLILDLEHSENNQLEIDNKYDELVNIIQDEMNSKLDKRKVYCADGISNKRRKMKKPWWNDNLTVLWNEVCAAERIWRKNPNRNERKSARHVFVKTRKTFDKNCQQAKRQYWYRSQEELCAVQNGNPREFWKKIGRIGVGNERQKNIPMEVLHDDGSICTDTDVVLNKWKISFDNLLNCKDKDNLPNESITNNISDDFLDCEITIDEVLNVLIKAKNGKAPGIDLIPIELYRNDILLYVLHNLFNKCFKFGKIPSMWSKGIITPIPKCSTADTRDPLSYRGITLAPCSYKLFCSILNNRLVSWLETKNILHDEQNGFRGGRSTIDHLSTLTSIIETRKLRKLSTFAVFVDFKKAYDTVNRNLLFNDLNDLGISKHFLCVIKAIYSQVECAIKLNGHMTEWFSVNSGLKQGCVLSPILFNIFINSLVTNIKALDIGIDIDGEKILRSQIYDIGMLNNAVTIPMKSVCNATSELF